MTTDQLQHLRDTGHGWAADEIEKLRKENAELKQQLAVSENTLDQERRNYKTAVKGFATACELHGAQLAEAQNQNEQMRLAIAGVIRVADRKTDEFDAAHDALAAQEQKEYEHYMRNL